MTVHRDGTEDDWVWVDANAPPSAPRPTASPELLVKEVDAADAWWTGVPHMVWEILSVADACDGEMILAARPTLVTVGDVDGLISAHCDPGRRGTALVAAPIPDVPVPRLIGHVEQLTRECVGLAGTTIDTGAAAKLEESFAPSHSVPLGAIRTFLPEVDPASAVDARPHRSTRPDDRRAGSRQARAFARAGKPKPGTEPAAAFARRQVDRMCSGRSLPPSCEPSRKRHQALSPAGQMTGPLARFW